MCWHCAALSLLSSVCLCNFLECAKDKRTKQNTRRCGREGKTTRKCDAAALSSRCVQSRSDAVQRKAQCLLVWRTCTYFIQRNSYAACVNCNQGRVELLRIVRSLLEKMRSDSIAGPKLPLIPKLKILALTTVCSSESRLSGSKSLLRYLILLYS